MTGRLVFDSARNGAFNMAADSYLAYESRKRCMPALRLYRWKLPTLSLGFHQKLSESVLEKCGSMGVPVVRRPTGGRAVLHDHELTYCLTLPEDHVIFKNSRGDLLKEIGSIFVLAAEKAGLNAQLVRAGSRDESPSDALKRGSPLCFDAVSRWEVQLSGKKWIGSAQRFLPGVLLQHGSILLGKSEVDIARLFNLRGSTDRELSISDDQRLRLQEAIPKAFSDYWGIDWIESSFDSAEIKAIKSTADNYSILDLKDSRHRKSA